MSSWKQKMKDADFHKKYDLNINPAHGPTYIPKGTKVNSPNRNNPSRTQQDWTNIGKTHSNEYRYLEESEEEEDYIEVEEEDWDDILSHYKQEKDFGGTSDTLFEWLKQHYNTPTKIK